MRSNISEMIKAANTILNHIDGILLHIKTNITNGKIEGMNSKLRGFTKRAFGFKTSKNLKITIFIALGKLNLTPAYLPTLFVREPLIHFTKVIGKIESIKIYIF
jgi:hypothetical protein